MVGSSTTGSEPGGRVVEVWRYPVKSLQGERLVEAVLEADGLAGDRALGIRDATTGTVLTGRRDPPLLFAAARTTDGGVVLDLPDGVSVTGVPGPEADAALSAWLGRPVALVSSVGTVGTAEAFLDATDDDSQVMSWQMPAGRFVDAGPLLVLSTASLRAGAAEHPGGAWDVRRFRPNLVVDVGDQPFTEDGWVGRTMQVGGAQLRVLASCSRCTMVTRPQPGLDRDLDVFRTVARVHDATFGVWAAVEEPATIREGDPVIA